MKTIYYYLDRFPKSRLGHFRYQLSKHLKEIKTNNNASYKYNETKVKSKAHIIVNFVTQSTVDKICSGTKGLSCSLVGDPPNTIFFSLRNWDTGAKYPGSLKDYRRYLILHEFLHCYPHYLQHPSKQFMDKYCTGKIKNRVPIMYQQSRGLDKNWTKCYL